MKGGERNAKERGVGLVVDCYKGEEGRGRGRENNPLLSVSYFGGIDPPKIINVY